MIKTSQFCRFVARSSAFPSRLCKAKANLSSVGHVNPGRERMFYDVITIGAGPAGLCAAIRLKQLAKSEEVDISVCVVEKGAELGAHILSGNVFETRALDELFPNWKELNAPLQTAAKNDQFLILTETSHYQIPNILLPPQLHNEGNYIISLSKLVRWLGEKAEELGVEIYPGFSASEVLYDKNGTVIGVATQDAGIAKDGQKKDSYTTGIELIARCTLFAEGCRGSCSEMVIQKFNLREGKDVQTYGLGIKEVWEVPSENFKSGFIQHSLGWPLQSKLIGQDNFGGSFLYHMEPNLVLIGMVVGLDYQNPYLNPYKEFQKWKHHPEVSKHLTGGTCIAYGARCLNEGGYHSIPKLSFPGGALIGCSAGFLNAIKIKGSHTAMKSGMLAAESLYPALIQRGEEHTVAAKGGESFFQTEQWFQGEDASNVVQPEVINIVEYEQNLLSSWVGEELKYIRNTHSAFKYGTIPGMLHSGLSCFITKGWEPWTIANTKPDWMKTKAAKESTPIEYPKPDGKISFDLLTNLQRSGTYHDHDQPAHLKVKTHLAHIPKGLDPKNPTTTSQSIPTMLIDTSLQEFAGPEQRFCPAGVYEYASVANSNDPNAPPTQQLVINAQNCVHCKCCSIKTPHEYIQWTVPEGGGGPAYTVM